MGADSPQRLEGLKSILPPRAISVACDTVDVSYAIRPAPAESPADGIEFVAYVDGQMLARFTDYETVLVMVERHLHLHVAEYAPRRVFVHAGVVGWNDRAVIFPGRTFAGKSTLVAAFLHAGATYYSDEFAVVDQRGWIHPYPQPISLRDQSLAATRIDPADFPAPVGKKALKAGLILITWHDKAKRRARLAPATPGEGMLALLANTVSARRDPGRALRNLKKTLDGARVLKGARGEAQLLVAQLMRSGRLADG
jgi:hypothetical protein